MFLIFVVIGFHGFHGFSATSVSSAGSLSPIQELEPGATPFAVVGVALLAILTDHSSLKTKKYFDYDYKIPPMESDHRKGLAGRGMGR